MTGAAPAQAAAGASRSRTSFIGPAGLLLDRVLVALGGTAAKALLGPRVRILRGRRQLLEAEFSKQTVIPVHPSSRLRAPEEVARAEACDVFIRNLRFIADLMTKR